MKYSQTAAKLGSFLPEKYNKHDEAPPEKSITSSFAYAKSYWQSLRVNGWQWEVIRVIDLLKTTNKLLRIDTNKVPAAELTE